MRAKGSRSIRTDRLETKEKRGEGEIVEIQSVTCVSPASALHRPDLGRFRKTRGGDYKGIRQKSRNTRNHLDYR